MPLRLRSAPATGSTTARAAVSALRTWTGRQVGVAALAAVAFALLIGLSTVLIPNPVFGREIASLWWNYPVWLLGSALAGMLVATYVRRDQVAPPGTEPTGTEPTGTDRPSRLGLAGGALTWFAVGCPVCNKIALLALGYTGAIQWFAPLQPVLAVLAIALTGSAVVVRLANQDSCALPA